MKFSVDKTVLLKALDRCKSVTDAKSTTPILSHVRLELNEDKLLGCLTLGATDLFQSVETDIHVNIDEPGSGCLNARDLYDRVKQLPDGDVKFTTDGASVTIKAAKTPRKFKLSLVPADEFPSLPKMRTDIESIRIKDKDLAGKLDAVLYAVSTDETRAFLNSVLLEENGGNTRFVATDGHRLAVLSSSELVDSGSSRWLIPLKGAKELLKLCTESGTAKHDDHEVVLYPDTDNLFVLVNGFKFSCKLTNANYPPYGQVIPSSWQHTIKVSRLKLIDAIKALSVSTGQSKAIKLCFEENKLLIDVKSEAGDADDEIECECEKIDETYSVSAQYMLDALEPVNTAEVVLKLSGGMDQVLIEENNDLKEYIAIVMPIRSM